ncbi:hypothetical protein [Actinomycetia phage DSL-LC01]|nr:hypothetical protein [Actinomycetia phage DSL-LC01]
MAKKNYELTAKYAEKIKPILPLAKKAYGSRAQETPAHKASRKYTQLLNEYVSKGGSLIALSRELDVAYSGMRRRVFTSQQPPVTTVRGTTARPRKSKEETEAAVARVKKARDKGTAFYHEQLAKEYAAGISLNVIARGLGITNASPLYYGVQRYTASVNKAS